MLEEKLLRLINLTIKEILPPVEALLPPSPLHHHLQQKQCYVLHNIPKNRLTTITATVTIKVMKGGRADPQAPKQSILFWLDYWYGVMGNKSVLPGISPLQATQKRGNTSNLARSIPKEAFMLGTKWEMIASEMFSFSLKMYIQCFWGSQRTETQQLSGYGKWYQ